MPIDFTFLVKTNLIFRFFFSAPIEATSSKSVSSITIMDLDSHQILKPSQPSSLPPQSSALPPQNPIVNSNYVPPPPNQHTMAHPSYAPPPHLSNASTGYIPPQQHYAPYYNNYY